MIGIALITLTITIFGYILIWAYNRNNYWRKKGIKSLPGLPFVGNCLPVILNKKSVGEILEDIYKAYPNELVIGYFEFTNPRLLIRDNDLLQKVLVTDFGHFVDHGFEVNEEKSPLDNQLFAMNGNKWRAFRSNLAPLFTSSKLKGMYDVMSDVGESLLKYLDENKTTDVDIREAMGLFSMDVIGSAAFGINPEVLKNPQSDFREMGKRVNDVGIMNLIRLWLFICFPVLQKKYGFSFQQHSVIKYFSNIIKNAIHQRKKCGFQRNDFIQMMLQLKEKGHIRIKTLDPNDNYQQDELTDVFEINDDVLMAHALSFLTAGFEATALVITYALLELCMHPEIQDALREEIMEQVKLNGGLTYEALKSMKLMKQIVKETERLYSLIPFLSRMCTKAYTLPNGFTIEKGDFVYIPVTAIHMDPNFYPDPKCFKPERFAEQPKPGTFIPFGDGPRMCVGVRYATLVIKYGLALFLMNYSAKLSPATKLPVQFVNRSFGYIPSEKILFRIEKLN
ncbi:cytochrome P450 9e2 isoform X1 [Halyomorpha halys]|uniref:cytochrome P450 9e2 isoform X1 n=1 Tax=Halyomorpha halys TaxID=286706 RepID=UPI0006D4D3BD